MSEYPFPVKFFVKKSYSSITLTPVNGEMGAELRSIEEIAEPELLQEIDKSQDGWYGVIEFDARHTSIHLNSWNWIDGPYKSPQDTQPDF